MSIPDEVLRQASRVNSATYEAAFHRASINQATDEAYRASAQVIAEWARREALREAAEAAAAAIPYGVEARSDAVHAILALRKAGREESK